jgi:hypothetical protein
VCDFYYYDGISLTNNNLYNLYWRRTIGQINEGKMLTAYFDLKEMDIQALRLNDKIRIDNSWWQINRVIDYDANSEALTKVELMSVDSEIDLPPFNTRPTVQPNISGVVRPIKQISRDIISRANVNLSPGTTDVTGFGNVIVEGVRGRIDGQYKTMTQDGIDSPQIRTTLGLSYTNTDYTVRENDQVVFCEGTLTITLPTLKVVNGVPTNGQTLTIKNIGTAGTVTVDGSGTQAIDRSSTFPLAPGDAIQLVSAELNWWII